MTPAEQAAELIKRRQEIEKLLAGQFTETHRWLVASVEFLLQEAAKGTR
jgi:hypothetical protein